MNYFNSLKDLEQAEIKEKVKEFEGEDSFLEEVISNKDEFVPFLMKNRSLTEKIISVVSKNREGISVVLEQFKSVNYIPGKLFLDNVIVYGDDQVLKDVLVSFPSLKLDIQTMIQVINSQKFDSAKYLILKNKEFQKEELLLKVLDNELIFSNVDSDFLNLGLNYSSFINKVLKSTPKEKSESIKEFCHKILDLKDLEIEGNNSNIILLKNSRNLEEFMDCLSRIKDSYNDKLDAFPVEYQDFLEEDSGNRDLLFLLEKNSVILKNVPKKSKLRNHYESTNPQELTDEDLVSLYKSERVKGHIDVYSPYRGRGVHNKETTGKLVEKEIIKRGVRVLSQIDLSAGFKYMSPSEVCLNINKEKANYLYNVLPVKYHKQLSKHIDSAKVKKFKKTYFSEIFEAIRSESLNSIREYTPYYSLAEFSKDSHQSSKKISCGLTRVSSKVLLNLTKEELFSLVDSTLPFGWVSKKLNYELTAKEAEKLSEKLDISYCFENCFEKKELLGLISQEQLGEVFNKHNKEIVNDKDLFKTYLKSNKKSSLNSEELTSVAKKLDKETIMKNFDLESYSLSGMILIKDVNGEYIISDKKIKTEIGDLIETTEFLESLEKRDPEFLKELIDAYLSGNKALSKIAGKDVKVRRKKIEFFEKYKKDLSTDYKVLVDEIFSRGGSFNEFKDNLIHPGKILKKFGEGRVVKVESIHAGSDDLDDLLRLGVPVEINTLNIKHSLNSLILKKAKINNLKLESLGNHWGDLSSQIKKIKELNKPVTVSDCSRSDLLELLDSGIELSNREDAIKSILFDSISSVELEELVQIEKHGLMYTEDVIKELLETYDLEIYKHIHKRLGDLSGFLVVESDFDFYDDETVEQLKSQLLNMGVKIKSSEEYSFETAVQDLNKIDFLAIDISRIPKVTVVKLIKYIEDEIDPRYKSLNLRSTNLEEIDELDNYENMKMKFSQTDEDVIRFFALPNNLASNKQIILGLKNLMSLTGGNIISKLSKVKELSKILSGKELGVQNLLDYSNQKDVKLVDELNTFNYGCNMPTYDLSVFFKNKSDKKILKLMVNYSNCSDTEIRDIVQMSSNISEALIEFKKDEENKEAVESIKEKLLEISELENFDDIHDRLVKLSSFIKSNPKQSLKQNKFSKLEKNYSKLGNHSLYFPKTRGDLIILGDDNGWCVNTHSSYGNGVISDGNILVAICRGEPLRENVVALAHFVKSSKGSFYLEQLKWSKKEKNGDENVDAEKDFNHAEILRILVSHLKKDEETNPEDS